MGASAIRVGITLGDPSGIGPEICVKAAQLLSKRYKLVVIGDASVWRKTPGVEFIDLANVDRKKFKFGRVKAEYGRASIEYLDKALELIRKREIDCVVTGPISKEAINLAGFRYSGHTEYFAEKAKAKNVVMMLINDRMKFSLVTRHIPLKDVSAKIDPEKIRNTLLITQKALKELFGIRSPRMVVCGINPHGSDNGIIGNEENRLIRPAVVALKRRLPGIAGPLGADVAIAKAARGKYDCVIAMYHDQALIPLKLLGDENGVNLSLGLGFVRSSPLHGTAFDIAGKNIASCSSLVAAIKLAYQCTLNQKKA